jgi:hypothetical protein
MSGSAPSTPDAEPRPWPQSPAGAKDAARTPAPVQPIPALPLAYAPAEPKIPLLGPRRVLPIDRAMAAFFFGLGAISCLAVAIPPHADALGQMCFLVTLGCGYLLLRIWYAPAVPPPLRAQLMVAALLCVVATVAAGWIYYDWPYDRRRTVVRPHPPSLYVAMAGVGLTAAWFAAVKLRVRRAAKSGRLPQERKERP